MNARNKKGPHIKESKIHPTIGAMLIVLLIGACFVFAHIAYTNIPAVKKTTDKVSAKIDSLFEGRNPMLSASNNLLKNAEALNREVKKLAAQQAEARKLADSLPGHSSKLTARYKFDMVATGCFRNQNQTLSIDLRCDQRILTITDTNSGRRVAGILGENASITGLALMWRCRSTSNDSLYCNWHSDNQNDALAAITSFVAENDLYPPALYDGSDMDANASSKDLKTVGLESASKSNWLKPRPIN